MNTDLFVIPSMLTFKVCHIPTERLFLIEDFVCTHFQKIVVQNVTKKTSAICIPLMSHNIYINMSENSSFLNIQGVYFRFFVVNFNKF